MKSNGPGKSFRKGMTIKEIMRLFPDDATAEAWFVSRRWPDGIRCANCDSDNVQTKTTHPTMPYRCRACREFFSVKTGTVMRSAKAGYQDWALAMYILATSLKGVSSMKLHRDLGITQSTAWHLAMKIRETWADKQVQFVGPVEVDETYMGGKERNKHESKKLNAGRGPVGKTAVLGAKDRESNQVVATPVPDTTGKTLKGFVKATTGPDAMVYTDEHAGYRGLSNHETVAHSAGEYVRGHAHTNGVESFWSMLKRGYVGTYHQLSVKHLDRYVNEFSGRHNSRPLDAIDQMSAMAHGMVGKQLRYSDITA